MFSRLFWLDALERAVKTAAQTVLLTIGQDLVGFDVFAAEWQHLAGFGLGGAVLSLLTSIASAGTDGVSPASLIDAPRQD